MIGSLFLLCPLMFVLCKKEKETATISLFYLLDIFQWVTKSGAFTLIQSFYLSSGHLFRVFF